MTSEQFLLVIGTIYLAPHMGKERGPFVGISLIGVTVAEALFRHLT